MNIKQIKEVMNKYGKAWEKRDTKLLLQCFTKNGTYQESPLAKPYKGQAQIKKFWDKTVRQETAKIKFKTGKIYISKDGKTGFAEWDCKNTYKGRKNHMTGIIILKMKGNKISYLNEYWNSEYF